LIAIVAGLPVCFFHYPAKISPPQWQDKFELMNRIETSSFISFRVFFGSGMDYEDK
jgi:hypothetical protein